MKRCPFCRGYGSPVIDRQATGVEVYVECGCGARGPDTWMGLRNVPGDQVLHAIAIEKWDTRPEEVHA